MIPCHTTKRHGFKAEVQWDPRVIVQSENMSHAEQKYTVYVLSYFPCGFDKTAWALDLHTQKTYCQKMVLSKFHFQPGFCSHPVSSPQLTHNYIFCIVTLTFFFWHSLGLCCDYFSPPLSLLFLSPLSLSFSPLSLSPLSLSFSLSLSLSLSFCMDTLLACVMIV